jgi:hypothetical protein
LLPGHVGPGDRVGGAGLGIYVVGLTASAVALLELEATTAETQPVAADFHASLRTGAHI